MGLAYNVYLNSNKIYGCKNCKTHLADHDAIISRVCDTTSPEANILLLIPLTVLCNRISVANMAKPTSSTPSSTSSRARPVSAT